MFLHDRDEYRKRLRNRAVLLIGALALAGLDGMVREADVGKAANNNARPLPPAPPAADGGTPLYLELPPDIQVKEEPGPDRNYATPLHSALGIPETVLSAYQRAAGSLAATAPGCRLTWPVLAGIGRVESNHARNGDLTPSGDMRAPIYGPELDGTGGKAAIRDDGSRWARAAGPMQFIAPTWAEWAADGSGDGRRDPQNVYDATLTAGRYLCAGNKDLSIADGLRGALMRYNHSEQYVYTVTGWIRAYEQNGIPVPDRSGGGRDEPASPGRLAVSSPVSPPARNGAPAPPDHSGGAKPPAESHHEPAPPPPGGGKHPSPGCPDSPQPTAPAVQPVLCPEGPVADAVAGLAAIGNPISDPSRDQSRHSNVTPEIMCLSN